MLKTTAKILLLIWLAVALLPMLAGCENVANSQTPVPTGEGSFEANAQRRDFYTKKQGGGHDVFTLMLYMCGSDLETYGGSASGDLDEIYYGLSSGLGDKLNIIVETGGAKEWEIALIDSSINQRWLMDVDGLVHLEDIGLRDMTDPDTLTDFIRYCAEYFPADRYGLIMWDHGGGTLGGFAVDEHFPESTEMSISEINAALSDAGVKFDFIGFDACLMATAETAFMVEQHADYMIASQRVEPGMGWYYVDFISALSADTSIDTLELGCIIVDSYIREAKESYYGNELTLSVIDLSYISDLFYYLYDYFSSAEYALINDAAFVEISRARYDSRVLTGNKDQVDLVYLVDNMAVMESEALMESLERCVAYNGATIANHNGLCIYFPYTDLSWVEEALDIYYDIGIDENYRNFISTFATLMVGGQIYGGSGSGNPYGDDYDEDCWQEYWVDYELIDEYCDYYAENCYSGELEIYEKGDYYALWLSEDDWDYITDIELEVYLDDGEGYIKLGQDNLYSFDEDGELIVEFDNTWVALDGQIVCFYAMEDVEEEGFWYSWGVTPAELNGREVEIVLMWDDENPGGYVVGVRNIYDSSVTGKGIFELHDGDEIYFLCDYYTYDEEYIGNYYWGGLTVYGELEVSYEDVGNDDCLVYYLLYDIYQNMYWTEPLLYYYDW